MSLVHLTDPSDAIQSQLHLNVPDIRTTQLTVTGTTTFSGGCTLTGDASLTGALSVVGNTTLGGTLGVTGSTTLGGVLGVTGNTTIGGSLSITGNVSSPNLTVSGSVNTPSLTATTIGATTITATNETLSGALTAASVSGTNVIMNGTNLNQLLNQDVRTTASPQFQGVTVRGTNSVAFLYPPQIPTHSNTIMGDATSGLTFDSGTFDPVTFKQFGTAVLQIGAVGSGSSQTAGLMINPSTKAVDYRTDGVFTGASQTLTNKTVDSASNTIQVNGTDINTYVNQAVKSTSFPQFTGVAITPVEPGTLDTNILTIGTSFPAAITRRTLASIVSPTPSYTSLTVSGTSTLGDISSSGSYSNSGQPCMIKTAASGTLVQTCGNTTYNILDCWGGSGTTFSQGGITYSAGVWTVPIAGVYMVDYHFAWQGNSSGDRYTWLLINNASLSGNEIANYMAGSPGQAPHNVTAVLHLNASDNVRVMIFQSSGTSLAVDTNLGRCCMSVTRLY